MAKKLGKCARCPTKLTPGHFHNLNGVRLCDNCYPYEKDPENGRLVYKKIQPVIPMEEIKKE
jgi:recombinational DNA repair protein (RecF pathway)